jgi:regulatory protein
MPDRPRPSAAPRPAPTEAALHDAALAHLARFAATEAGLLRVLTRRIDRWAREAEATASEPETVATAARQARGLASEIVRRLAAAGAVDDAAFAAARARRLHRSGRSRRAVGAHLAAHGVRAEQAEAVLPEDPQAELAAALAFARRRRLGPFGAAEPDQEAQRRALAAFARAGFPQAVAQQALQTPQPDAEDIVQALRRS